MSFFGLFSIGFIMGLTGAMAPGPLLTVTIGESTRRGGIVGPMVILGHGVLELALLLLIVLGAANFLNNRIIFAVIALAGGIILVFIGLSTIRDLRHYSLSVEPGSRKAGLHPVLSGIVISLSNPYWFIWWITIGMGYVIFARGYGIYGILAFFAGHILSDLSWYSFVSYGVQFGGKYMSLRIIKGVLLVCSIFLIMFGLFFIVQGYNFIQ